MLDIRSYCGAHFLQLECHSYDTEHVVIPSEDTLFVDAYVAFYLLPRAGTVTMVIIMRFYL